MPSAKQAGKSSASNNARSPRTQPKPVVLAKAPKQATVPWYFWVVLGAIVVIAIVLLGTLLGGNPAAGNNTAVAPTAGKVADARQLLTNGYGEGNANAAVKIVEYGDFECPACAYFFQNVYPQLNQQYIQTGKVYFYYKPFPLESIHPKALKAAELATCAGDYGSDKFFQIHDLLYDNQNTWVNGNENSIWPGYLNQAGLDATKVMACVANNTHQAAITVNENEGANVGVNSTPSFFVNTKLLVGPTIDQMVQAINDASK